MCAVSLRSSSRCSIPRGSQRLRRFALIISPWEMTSRAIAMTVNQSVELTTPVRISTVQINPKMAPKIIRPKLARFVGSLSGIRPPCQPHVQMSTARGEPAMSDRYCIRGCMARDSHLAACERSGEKYEGVNPCRGCAPVDARDGVLICERCYRRLRRYLEDAADVVGHLRSIADPTKAAAYDRVRVQSSSIEIPAPVAADLIDASNDITTTMNMWANHVAGEDRPGAGLGAGATADAAHDIVQLAVDVILEDLDVLAHDSHQIGALCDGVVIVNGGAPEVWTVADAAVRWPLEDSPRWAQAACPSCDLLAVRVQPGRSGRPARYRCSTDDCDWEANSNDDGGLWASVFVDPASAEVRRHDPRWLTLAEAARLVRRTPGTVRGWVLQELIEPQLGCYWQDDVLAVAAQKKGVAA